jgi:hypothetical protein
MSDFNKPTNPPAFPSDAVKDPFDKSGMTLKEKVNLAMAWYDSGLEDRAEFQTLMESILAQPPQRTWVGLTDEDRAEILTRKWWNFEDEFDVDGFLRLTEDKLKEKNT